MVAPTAAFLPTRSAVRAPDRGAIESSADKLKTHFLEKLRTGNHVGGDTRVGFHPNDCCCVDCRGDAVFARGYSRPHIAIFTHDCRRPDRRRAKVVRIGETQHRRTSSGLRGGARGRSAHVWQRKLGSDRTSRFGPHSPMQETSCIARSGSWARCGASTGNVPQKTWIRHFWTSPSRKGMEHRRSWGYH